MDKKIRFRRGLYRFFLGIDIFFGILTFIFIFVFPPVGLIGVAVTVLYALVAISIKQSINGKKPIFDLFREGTKTCRKCKHKFAKKEHLTCPYCARVREFKRKYAEFIKSKTPPPKDEEHEDFWEELGTLMLIDSLFDGL